MRASIVDAPSLSTDRIAEMFALFDLYYDNVDLDVFVGDLRNKQRVILLHHDEDLVGFTTIAGFDYRHEGALKKIIFSGDTIVRRDFWGEQMLALSWLREIGRMAGQAPATPLYWLLIVKGHRTYRYLPTFGLEFVPHWRGPPPPGLASLRDALAHDLFGDCYDAADGIVRFENRRGNLKPRCATPSARERRRPDVDFFLRSNPGYVEGDELVCLCSLSPDNMRPYARRLFEQGFDG